MARNGSGSYSLPSGNPVVTGTTISSTDFNNTMTDLATAITGSVAVDGQSPMTGNLPMGGNRVTGTGAAGALTDVTTAADVQSGRLCTMTGTAGTNTITGSVPLLGVLSVGQQFLFIPAATNTGAVTLNINSLGAQPVCKLGGLALGLGDIIAGATSVVSWDGSRFQLLHLQTPSVIAFSTSGVAVPDSVTRYMGANGVVSASESDTFWRVPAAGYIRAMYSQIPGAAAGTRQYTLRNNSVDQMSCSATGASTQASNTTNPFGVSAGDIITCKIVTSGGSDAVAHNVTAQFVALA